MNSATDISSLQSNGAVLTAALPTPLADDHPHEECGVAGVWSSEDIQAARLIYYGLIALQHRGQESAGIVVCDTKGPLGNICQHKGMGLVSEVFPHEKLDELQGNIGIGHVRYSTTGGSCAANAQPVFLNYLKGTLGMAHNGNIMNIDSLRTELEKEGARFSGTTDSEVVAYEIARARMEAHSIEEAVIRTAKKLRGGYALLIVSPQKLLGVRDPLGLKPLCLGKKSDQTYFLASESSAIESMGGTFIRDIEPGEIISISEEGVYSNYSLRQEKRAHCIFEYIYFARQDSVMDGISVYEARVKGGHALAARHPADADVVIGVPDSGLPAAIGFAEESGIPFRLGFYKNSYVGRTFIKPSQEERVSAVHLKLSILKSAVAGKRVVLIDDSIVRGTTMANLILMLRAAGAREVHVRISSPPFLYPCYYGTDVPDNQQLIANELTIEGIRRHIDADSLAYMAIEDLKKMTGDLPLCSACFDNHYPV